MMMNIRNQGEIRTHSLLQNLATWHFEHVLSLRRAPHPKQHATVLVLRRASMRSGGMLR
jgi:hypothetical protein